MRRIADVDRAVCTFAAIASRQAVPAGAHTAVPLRGTALRCSVAGAPLLRHCARAARTAASRAARRAGAATLPCASRRRRFAPPGRLPLPAPVAFARSHRRCPAAGGARRGDRAPRSAARGPARAPDCRGSCAALSGAATDAPASAACREGDAGLAGQSPRSGHGASAEPRRVQPVALPVSCNNPRAARPSTSATRRQRPDAPRPVLARRSPRRLRARR